MIIHDLTVSADDRIILAGEITKFENQSVAGLIRLNPDGTIDNSFNFSGSEDIQPRYVGIQYSGNITLGSSESLARLTSTGELVSVLPDIMDLIYDRISICDNK